MSEYSERVRAQCARCKKTDDHPKHHVEEHNHTHHFDCGREVGCISCDAILRASGDLHGDRLTKFMKSRVAIPIGA